MCDSAEVATFGSSDTMYSFTVFRRIIAVSTVAVWLLYCVKPEPRYHDLAMPCCCELHEWWSCRYDVGFQLLLTCLMRAACLMGLSHERLMRHLTSGCSVRRDILVVSHLAALSTVGVQCMSRSLGTQILTTCNLDFPR